MTLNKDTEQSYCSGATFQSRHEQLHVQGGQGRVTRKQQLFSIMCFNVDYGPALILMKLFLSRDLEISGKSNDLQSCQFPAREENCSGTTEGCGDFEVGFIPACFWPSLQIPTPTQVNFMVCTWQSQIFICKIRVSIEWPTNANSRNLARILWHAHRGF